MKKTFVFLFITLIAFSVAGQSKKILAGQVIKFHIQNLGVEVYGSLSGLSGKIVFNPQNPSMGSIDVFINTNTINTNNSGRDNHLKKAEYFDVEHYPTIHFVSKKIESTTSGYIVYGTLTIKGKTKEIKIPFTYAEQSSTGIFSAKFTVNRLDYGIGSSSWILADEVKIELSIKTEKE